MQHWDIPCRLTRNSPGLLWQNIKGWYQNGYPQEKIYDVALSDNRNPDPKTGKVPPVGNTVNIKEATYTNDIGDTQLSAVWTDPDFKSEYHTVYYVRVLEIPTPRWSTYDAKALGIAPPDGVAATIQERAWSSPIMKLRQNGTVS